MIGLFGLRADTVMTKMIPEFSNPHSFASFV